MLCTVALRRMHAENEAARYALRITGKTALGPSGTGGRDTSDGLSEEDLQATLRNLGLSDDARRMANAILHDPESSNRFTSIAEDVQIPFEVLERADIHLFD